MERLEKAAVILGLIEEMGSRGSWCGETHIQKACYFLQELLCVPTSYQFILYKHGPFSFELRDDLTGMRADGLLTIIPKPFPYGPSLILGENSSYIIHNFSYIKELYQERIIFIADRLANKGVAELERLATAYYVTRELKGESSERRAKRLHELKPHVSPEEAKEAVIMVDKIIDEVASNFTLNGNSVV